MTSSDSSSEQSMRWFHDPWRYSAVGVAGAILTALLYVLIGELEAGTFALVAVGMVLLYLPLVWTVSGIDSVMDRVVGRG